MGEGAAEGLPTTQEPRRLGSSRAVCERGPRCRGGVSADHGPACLFLLTVQLLPYRAMGRAKGRIGERVVLLAFALLVALPAGQALGLTGRPIVVAAQGTQAGRVGAPSAGEEAGASLCDVVRDHSRTTARLAVWGSNLQPDGWSRRAARGCEDVSLTGKSPQSGVRPPRLRGSTFLSRCRQPCSARPRTPRRKATDRRALRRYAAASARFMRRLASACRRGRPQALAIASQALYSEQEGHLGVSTLRIITTLRGRAPDWRRSLGAGVLQGLRPIYPKRQSRRLLVSHRQLSME